MLLERFSTRPGGSASSISIPSQSVEEEMPESDSTSTSSFEFSNGERGGHRSVLVSYHKPPPSKWDNAEKWLVGVSTERTKKVDTVKHTTGDMGAPHFTFQPVVVPPGQARSNELLNCYPIGDDTEIVCHNSERNGQGSYFEPMMRNENPISDFTLHERTPSCGFNTYDPPLSPHETSYETSIPEVRSVSMRDMGTEMTPLASQEPSRTGTPVRATTPTGRSPVSSRPSTPRKVTPAPLATQESEAVNIDDGHARPPPELTEKEIQAKTRREIFALGTQLGKTNIAAWASKQEEDEDAFKSLKNIDLQEVKKNVLETRAAAWEEAEKAKYMARCMREEAKIQAWENHEKAKAEAEMRRTEVKVEKLRSHAHEKLMNRLATVRRKAEERRATAEAKRCENAAKTAQHADYMRRTGRLPSSFSFFSLCW